jgi:hypothetical protein
VPIVCHGRRLHPDTHVVAGAATRTGKGWRINGPRRIENLDEIRGEIIDHTPAKTTANNDDLGIIGGVLQRSNWLRGVSVELAILLWHGGQNRNN